MLEAVVTDLPYESGDEVALMINGLGGTPISELYILYGRAPASFRNEASRWAAPTWASTARRSTWREPR
jgi:dihydroxyacetone kinase